jgi:hypothetical protein
MDDLFQTDSSFPFDDIKLKTPRALQGGTYIANLSVNDNNIIIQTPKCKTKKGITKTAKQLYCDLLFNQDHNDFIEWLESFQERVRELIFENSENWFHESPSLDDIEYNWNNSIRTYKQSNYLVRTFIHKSKNVKTISLQIYDSDQKKLNIEDVDKEKNVISILEIVGIKFSSQSFQLDVCLRQLMVLNEKPLFNKCLIRLDKPKQSSDNEKSLGENKKSKVLENIITNNNEENEENIEENEENIEENEENIEEHKKNQENNNEENRNKQSEQQTHTHTQTVKVVQRNDNEKQQLIQDREVAVDVEDVEHQIDQEDNEEKNKKQNIVLKNEVKKELDVEKEKQNMKDLEEIEINVNDSDEIKLKKPNEVYLDIYKEARNKARLAKKAAIKAYLEAKKIKELYMLDEIDSSSSESEEDLDEDGEIFSES